MTKKSNTAPLEKKRSLRSTGIDQDGGEPEAASVGKKRPTPSSQNRGEPSMRQSLGKPKKLPTQPPKKRSLRSTGIDKDGGDREAAPFGKKRPTESRTK